MSYDVSHSCNESYGTYACLQLLNCYTSELCSTFIQKQLLLVFGAFCVYVANEKFVIYSHTRANMAYASLRGIMSRNTDHNKAPGVVIRGTRMLM